MRGREKSKSCVSVAITLGAGEKKVLCYFIQPETTSHLLFLKPEFGENPPKLFHSKSENKKQTVDGQFLIWFLRQDWSAVRQ